MKRTFLTNVSLLIVLNVLIKAFWVLGIDRTVQNTVGAQEYGLYFSLYSFSILFNILLDFGLTNYNNRRVASDPSQLASLIGNIFLIRLCFSIVYLVVTLTCAAMIGYNKLQMSILLVLIINQFLASFILYLRSNISALQLFRLDSVLSVCDRLIMIIICAYLLWGGFSGQPFRIEWFVYTQTAAYFISFIISLTVVLFKAKTISLNFRFSELIKILKESMPFALLALFMAIYWRVDSVMLERMLNNGAVQAGIYAQAYRLLDASSMIPYLFALILLPLFTKIISDGKDGFHLLRFATIMLIIPAGAVSVISVFFSSELMDLLYINHVSGSAKLLAILMTAYVPVSIIYVFSTYLTALGKLKILNMAAFTAMLFNVILNYLLIPKFGVSGAAWASISAQIIMSLILCYFIFRLSSGRKALLLISQIIIYISLVTISASVIDKTGFHWLTSAMIISFLAIIYALIIRLIDYYEIRAFFVNRLK